MMVILPLLLFCFSVTAISAEINDKEDPTPDPNFAIPLENFNEETTPYYDDEDNYPDEQNDEDNYNDEQNVEENYKDEHTTEENYEDDQDKQDNDNDEGTYNIQSAKDLSPCELKCRRNKGSPVKKKCGKPKKQCKKQCKKPNSLIAGLRTTEACIGGCKRAWDRCFFGMREERQELHTKCSTKCGDQNDNTTVTNTTNVDEPGNGVGNSTLSTDSNTLYITTVQPDEDNEDEVDNDYGDEGTSIDNIKSAKDLSQCERKCRREEGSPVRKKCGMPKKKCQQQCRKECSSRCHKSWKICFDGMKGERAELHRECSAECSEPVDPIPVEDFEPAYTKEPLPSATCKCNGKLGDDGRGECEMHTAKRKQTANNLFWCFVDSDAECSDKKPSKYQEGWFWSMEACKAKEDLMDMAMS